MFKDYESLFDEMSDGLAKSSNFANINTELQAEQYRRKFTEFLMLGKKLNPVTDKDVYMGLFDVMHTGNKSDSLTNSKYPKLALNFIIGELSKYLGMSYKDFLKLTIEETDILLDIVTLKQESIETVNEELYKDLNKEKKSTDDQFMFGGI